MRRRSAVCLFGVVLLEVETDQSLEHPAQFDVSGDGEVDVTDVRALLNDLTDST